MKHKVLIFVVVAAAMAAIQAQEQPPPEMRRAVAELQTTVSSFQRLAVESTVTKGAPYSAEAVTEFQQVLSDGNRISRRTVVRIYRDSEGRTRREQTTRTADGKESVSISIVDPVAQASFTLDPESRTAYRSGATVIAMPTVVSPSGMGSGARGGRGAAGGGGGAVGPAAPPAAVPVTTTPATAEGRPRVAPAIVPPEMPRSVTGPANIINKEELGQRLIEGVMADGTRTTTVIPAGAIGNAQDIKIVSEQWMSPDLGVLVGTKHSDPRSGETTYRLTNIIRAEQDRSLFEVPPDYTIQAGRGGGRGGRGGGGGAPASGGLQQ
jgi:hypothetical protein